MARNKAAGLVEIGRDAFSDLEACYHRNTRPPPRQERQPQYGNRPQQPYPTRRNSNHNSVPPKEAGEIDCNEAAKIYGGVLFKETGRKKKSPFGFGFSKAK